eukprot:CAMPEP_0184872700 /NCGR_PEP_ID=MMETSP0580-20130426/41436_1 /TAXON_ID=1118495 /ORGANISM="Dactyliosolen fragilissimus" /LENGTH=421 /DNA_ID=CAMNT_0027375535 /DNA_START=471 /DNA_END=1736 /DNA_ORIENTATION=-
MKYPNQSSKRRNSFGLLKLAVIVLISFLVLQYFFIARYALFNSTHLQASSLYENEVKVMQPSSKKDVPKFLATDSSKHIPQVLETDRIYHPRNGPFVIEEYKLVFFTIPKVACSEWKRMFMRMNRHPKWCAKKLNAHIPSVNQLKYLSDYPTDIATAIMTSPAWTRAVFVREPKERVLSAFLDKAVKEEYFARKCCDKLPNEVEIKKCRRCRHGNIKIDDEKSRRACVFSPQNFENFLHFVTKYPDECFDVHKLPNEVEIKKCRRCLDGEENRRACDFPNQDFINFLHFVTKYPDECFDVHWEPMRPKIDSKWWPYINFVGRQSDLKTDAKSLLEKLHSSSDLVADRSAWERYGQSGWGNEPGCENRTSEFLQENTSTHNIGTSSKLTEWYNTESENLVEKYWNVDWDIEGVQFEKQNLFS